VQSSEAKLIILAPTCPFPCSRSWATLASIGRANMLMAATWLPGSQPGLHMGFPVTGVSARRGPEPRLRLSGKGRARATRESVGPSCCPSRMCTAGPDPRASSSSVGCASAPAKCLMRPAELLPQACDRCITHSCEMLIRFAMRHSRVQTNQARSISGQGAGSALLAAGTAIIDHQLKQSLYSRHRQGGAVPTEYKPSRIPTGRARQSE
jgi:hypothetical protein